MLNVAQALAALHDLGFKYWDANENSPSIRLIARIYGLEPRVVYEIFTSTIWDD